MARDRHHRRPSLPLLPIILMIGGAAGAGYTTDLSSFAPSGSMWLSARAAPPGSGCAIKGNISIDTGERIYHVPGQTCYPQTRISSQYGERWFCSETEARQAGWRRSRT